MNKKQQSFVIFFAVACLGLTIWGLYELLKPKKMVGDKTGWVCDQSKQCTKNALLPLLLLLLRYYYYTTTSTQLLITKSV